MTLKTIFSKSLVFVLVGAFLMPAGLAMAEDEIPDSDSPEFATYIMTKIDDQYRGEKSHGVMEMVVKTKHWTRSIELESWSLEKDYSLMRILKPRKEKGNATLKAKGDLFTYLNKTGRTIKITSGMMGGSWMGSHFTNDDLIRHTRLSEDYKIELTFKGKENEQEVYRFTLIPNPDAPVVWGKLDITVRQSDLEPVSQVYYDEDGKKVRMLEFSNYKDLGERTIPTTMIMKPLDGSGEFTQIEWKKLDFEVKLKKSFFTIQRLKSM